MMINSEDSTITCNSTHLTSFAVLVDVSGGHQVYCDALAIHKCMEIVLQDTSSEERTVLSAISYIGCGISIACLLVTIAVLLYYRLVLMYNE